MNLKQSIDGNKYALSILLADITEARVRAAEILAPKWFVDSWVAAYEAIGRIQEQSK